MRKETSWVSGDEVIEWDFGLKAVVRKINQVAALDSPVLLLGETGTGKELLATLIHNQSLRGDNAMITVNYGAIPETLLDSQLFGHEKRAFTGALAQKKGHS